MIRIIILCLENLMMDTVVFFQRSEPDFQVNPAKSCLHIARHRVLVIDGKQTRNKSEECKKHQ